MNRARIRAREESPLLVVRAPGRAECGSRYEIDTQSLVVDSRRCIAQRLLYILWFEKGIINEQRRAVRISRKQFQNAANRDSHAPDARLSTAFAWLDRDAVKTVYRRHVLSLDHPRPQSGSDLTSRFKENPHTADLPVQFCKSAIWSNPSPTALGA